MKRLMMISALGVLLAGCSGSSDAENADTPDDAQTALEENSVNTAPDNDEEAEQHASEDAGMTEDGGMEGDDPVTDPETPMDDEALNDYEEYSTVKDVAPVDGLRGIVETDNPGTRVILYETDEGQKQVKSIFIKKENRLKVISLDEDGLLYNDLLN